MKVRHGVAFALLAWSMAACSDDVTVTRRPVERVTIVDRDGRVWDVTQAVLRYGLEKDGFLFGFGALSVPPLVSPPLVSWGESGFPAADDSFEVAGVSVDGDARAYGVNEARYFEVINDAAAARAIAVVFQPREDRLHAYLRTTESTALVLSSSGWVYGQRIVFFDYQTESLWYRLDGTDHLTCISGAYFGNTLEAIGVARSRWSDWFAANATTQVLVLPDSL